MTREDSRIRLLVVDDEQSIRRLCMTVGSSLEYLCTEAESAEAALGQSPAIPPDIVIADLRLPNLSGSDLLRQIKSRRVLSNKLSISDRRNTLPHRQRNLQVRRPAA